MLKLGIIGTNWITQQFVEAAAASKEYELTNVLPEDIKSSMPTIEEIEDELNGDN